MCQRLFCVVVILGCAVLGQSVCAETPIEERVTKLERDVRDTADLGLVLFLFGGFCAIWAQNTKRNPWMWFFLGLLFSVITVLFLLYKNADDRRMNAAMQ